MINPKSNEKDYPVKMNFGCFIPLLYFAFIGFFCAAKAFLLK